MKTNKPDKSGDVLMVKGHLKIWVHPDICEADPGLDTYYEAPGCFEVYMEGTKNSVVLDINDLYHIIHILRGH